MKSNPPRGSEELNNRPLRYWAIVLLACVASFTGGWWLHDQGALANGAPAVCTAGQAPAPLRLLDGGYQFISPLLACNLNATKLFPQSESMNSDIQEVITAHQNAGDIEKASVYFADFSRGEWANVNGSETYYPSSLGKVPIMMAYFAMAENSSTLLEKKIVYPSGSADLNAQQEITPEQAIVPGQPYSVSDLIDYMIKYSDNNAAQALFANANINDLKGIYSDLQIPVSNDITSSTLDFMTPQQYSILFRTLYNATYLTHDFSEEALRLMSQTSFTEGLVAGVPASTVVAHKFGIVSFYSGAAVTERELHDCGIIYAPSHPYLLCVMTRGSSSLSSMEQTISDISNTVYRAVEKGY